jgi:hypothetical protein
MIIFAILILAGAILIGSALIAAAIFKLGEPIEVKYKAYSKDLN